MVIIVSKSLKQSKVTCTLQKKNNDKYVLLVYDVCNDIEGDSCTSDDVDPSFLTRFDTPVYFLDIQPMS